MNVIHIKYVVHIRLTKSRLANHYVTSINASWIFTM